MQLRFLGATDTVTGSRFLLQRDETRILIDCGLFQGLKKLRQRNWSAFPLAPSSLAAVLLTHAHIDHSGWLPVLVRQGFRGPVYCTPATRDLCEILLPDAAHLQEEEAAFANRHGYSRHHPALPLFDRADAQAALELLRPVDFNAGFGLPGDLHACFTPAGHILGAACLRIEWNGRGIVFSGDVGRPADPIMHAPAALEPADWLVLESTYGERRHPQQDPAAELAHLVGAVAQRGGSLLIPSFAVGRAQLLLHLLTSLIAQGRVPKLPVYLDSPMAIDVTELFRRHPEQHRLSSAECDRMCALATYTRRPEESKAAMAGPDPKIVISASGMATGGRVLHHLKAMAGNPRHCILFAGYQAAGTRGAAMLAGVQSIKIHGEYYPVRAQVARIDSLSAHADYQELLDWLRPLEPAPRTTFVVHGEPAAQDAMRLHLRDGLGWEACIPEFGESVPLE